MIIDVHHHWIPKKYLDTLEKFMRKGESVVRDPWGGAHIWGNGIHLMPYNPIFVDFEKQIADMDEAGIDMAVLTEAHWHERVTMKTAPYINDAMAEVVAKYPKRFAGTGITPMEGKSALRELERVSKELKLSGICINTHIGYLGAHADDKRFWPFWEKVAELDIPVAVEPFSYNAESEPMWDFDIIFVHARRDNVLRFVLRMVYGPLLDKFPTLRILCPHLGAGFFFSVGPRLAAPIGYFAGEISLEKAQEVRKQKEERTARHLKQLYFDAAPVVTWGQAELTCAVEVYGEDHIMLGTDYPVGPLWLRGSVQSIESIRTTAQAKKKILGLNAAKFFGIPVRSDTLMKTG